MLTVFKKKERFIKNKNMLKRFQVDLFILTYASSFLIFFSPGFIQMFILKVDRSIETYVFFTFSAQHNLKLLNASFLCIELGVYNQRI